MKQAVFDMDGTLLDTMVIWQTLGARVLARYGLTPAPEDENLTARMSAAASLGYLHEHYHLPASIEEIQAAASDILLDFYRTESVAKPGAGAFLSALQQAEIPFGLVTATAELPVRTALRRAGLEQFFPEHLYSCTDHHTSKREAQPFQLMQAELGGAPAAATVIFEDAYYAAFTAKSAGFRLAVIYDASEPKAEKIRALADWYFYSWDEALTAFRAGLL